MFGLSYLKTNLNILALSIWVVLSHKLFDGQSVQNILVIFSLMISTKLVTHYNSTLCLVSQASLQIKGVECITLEVMNSIVKLRIIQHNIELV